MRGLRGRQPQWRLPYRRASETPIDHDLATESDTVDAASWLFRSRIETPYSDRSSTAHIIHKGDQPHPDNLQATRTLLSVSASPLKPHRPGEDGWPTLARHLA